MFPKIVTNLVEFSDFLLGGRKFITWKPKKRRAAKGLKEFFLNRKSSLNSSYFLIQRPSQQFAIIRACRQNIKRFQKFIVSHVQKVVFY